jgi:hypothetical protein
VPKKILYDNLKLVVLSRMGSEIRFNPKFMEFAGIYGFEAVPCNVARGNEKGKVENAIHYIRISFLSGREIISWAKLNAEAKVWLAEVANVRIHRTTRERPIDRWEKEKPFLYPTPSKPYDASIVRPVSSTHQALVRFDGNAYSVPHTYASRALLLRATENEVRFVWDGKQIACHPRSYERGLFIEDPKHYEGLLITKKKAFLRHLERRFLELGTVAKPYLEGLFEQELRVHRHLVEILQLVTTYSKEEVVAALSAAIEHGAFGSAYVKNILLQKRAAQGLEEILPITIPQKPAWNDLVTEEPDLSLYDKLTDPDGLI